VFQPLAGPFKAFHPSRRAAISSDDDYCGRFPIGVSMRVGTAGAGLPVQDCAESGPAAELMVIIFRLLALHPFPTLGRMKSAAERIFEAGAIQHPVYQQL